MSLSTQLRTGRHVVFNLHAHLVFVPKYRKKIFCRKMLEALQNMFSEICESFDVTLSEFDGEDNHVHLLVSYPPKVRLSTKADSLKGVSSRKLKQMFKKELDRYYWKGAFWSPSYFVASCGGEPLSIVKKYIQEQNTPA